MTFLNAVDIANRAAQMSGVPRIVDFNENSRQAGEYAFVYDKLRRAELRRNTWVFATRRAALRPIDQLYGTTLLLNAPMWASTTTYTEGSIVSDAGGLLWQGRSDDNLNNAPGNSTQWELYCGPVSVQPWDTTGQTQYFRGELVYKAPGDGTYNVFMSIATNNQTDPAISTLWVTSAVGALAPSPLTPVPALPNPAPGTFYKDQVVMFYAVWASGTTYAAGNAVAYNGVPYVSLVAGNLGNTPGADTTHWAALPITPGPLFWNSQTTYAALAFVTYKGNWYISLQATTGNTPSTSPTFWLQVAAPTYYSSLIDINLNNDPSQAPAAWSSVTTYSTGQSVYSPLTGLIYTSIGNGNLNNDPSATTGFWTNTNVLCPWAQTTQFGTANDSWLLIPGMALSDLTLVSPIGAGPTFNNFTRNLYRLPANYLRHAPQDPKAGSISFLGAPSGLRYDDWTFEGQYIVTRESFPIVLRFVADVTDVTTFDDMFCEGLACRIALETVETLTQSTAKKAGIDASYKRVMTEARLVDGIEGGAVEPPEDDWISCRW